MPKKPGAVHTSMPDGTVNAPDSRRTLSVGDRGSELGNRLSGISVTLLYEDPQTASSVPDF